MIIHSIRLSLFQVNPVQEKPQDPIALDAVFLKGMPDLAKLQCKKIIPIPPHIHALSIQSKLYVNTVFFELKIKENKGLLKTLLAQRIHPDVNLIDDSALNLSIEMSGGLIRQFLNILYRAAANARIDKAPQIISRHVEKACADLSSNLSRPVSFNSRLLRLLDHVRKTNQASDIKDEYDRKELVKAFLDLNIIAPGNILIFSGKLKRTIKKFPQMYIKRFQSCSANCHYTEQA